MLRQIFLNNFKAFAGEQKIPLAPLTLIFGKNSAGKSSILQSLLFLKQSIPYLAQGMSPLFSGVQTNLMSLEHTLHRQGNNSDFNELEIGLIVDSKKAEIPPIDNNLKNNYTGISFKWHRIGDIFQENTYRWRVHVGDLDNSPYFGDTGQTQTSSEQLKVRGRLKIAGKQVNSATPNLDGPYFFNLHKMYGSQLNHNFSVNLQLWIEIFSSPYYKFPALTNAQVEALQAGITGLRWINPAEAVAVTFGNQNSITRLTLAQKKERYTHIASMINRWFRLETASRNSNSDTQTNTETYHDNYSNSLNNLEEVERLVSAEYGPGAPERVIASHSDQYQDMPRPRRHLSRILSRILSDSQKQFNNPYDINDINGRFVFVEQFLEFHSGGLALDGEYRPGLRRILAFASEHRTIGLTENSEELPFYSPGSPAEVIDLAVESVERAMAQLQRVRPVRSPLDRFALSTREVSSEDTIKNRKNIKNTSSINNSDDSNQSIINRIADTPSLRDSINRAFDSLGIPYKISVRQITQDVFQGTTFLALTLTDTRTNEIEVGIPDVGYGIGQVLSLIETIESTRNACIIIEQPELHLHPGMQAQLGEFLVSAVSDSSGRQIIAETHSEHLILRIMKLIRKKKIDPSLVQIVYVDQDELGMSFTKAIEINAQGRFTTAWPRGFFEERMVERDDD